MKKLLFIFLASFLTYTDIPIEKQGDAKPNKGRVNPNELESDTVTITLEYYGWGCPCPQWITPENKIMYESKSGKDSADLLHLFLNIKAASDTVASPFDLHENTGNMIFKFRGQFYKQPQFMGDEGEQRPARTLLYYAVQEID